MQPGTQPIALALAPLTDHWHLFHRTPGLRLSRWLTTEANRPLLHDFLVTHSHADETLVRFEPNRDWVFLETRLTTLPANVIWLEQMLPDTGGNTERWLREQLEGNGSQRFIILENQADQPLGRLARLFPALVQTVTPNVCMSRLLTDLTVSAEPDLPESQFQQQFHQLSQAIANADKKDIEPLASVCVHTCKSSGWLLAEITVWLNLAAYYLTHRQADNALSRFTMALTLSEQAYAAGNATAGLVSIQAWLGEAAAWQQRRRSGRVITTLQLAVTRADLLRADHLGVEAARQLGVALDQAGESRASLDAYRQALQFAERLPPEQRPQASIQAVGKAYLNRLHTAPDRQLLRSRLAQLSC